MINNCYNLIVFFVFFVSISLLLLMVFQVLIFQVLKFQNLVFYIFTLELCALLIYYNHRFMFYVYIIFAVKRIERSQKAKEKRKPRDHALHESVGSGKR